MQSIRPPAFAFNRVWLFLRKLLALHPAWIDPNLLRSYKHIWHHKMLRKRDPNIGFSRSACTSKLPSLLQDFSSFVYGKDRNEAIWEQAVHRITMHKQNDGIVASKGPVVHCMKLQLESHTHETAKHWVIEAGQALGP